MLSNLEVKHTLLRVIDVLRYDYSPSEIRNLVLRLLLFKRLSDLSDKREESLSVPKEAHWSIVEQEQHNLAKRLTEVLRLIEADNYHLQGVLTDTEVDFWGRFGDKTLSRVIELLSELDLSGREPNDLEQLSEVDAWFMEDCALKELNMRGVYTPRQLTAMMVKLLNPQNGTTICDPACGSGEFLTEVTRFIRQKGENISAVRIYGQAESTQECAITKTNLILHGIDNPDIHQGNVIFEPRFLQANDIGSCDIVLFNPPFNLKYSPQTLDELRNSNQFIYGVPDNGIGDLLFVQQALRFLKRTGKAAIILPRGALFRKGGEEDIRNEMIKDDLIEAVIELAPKLFYKTSIPITVIVFNRGKLHKGKVLFIDASREYKTGRGQNLLQAEHIEHIVSTYREVKEEEGFSRLVSVEEIADNKYNLSINRYIITLTNTEQIDIATEVEKLHQLEIERSELEEKIDNYLKALGIEI